MNGISNLSTVSSVDIILFYPVVHIGQDLAEYVDIDTDPWHLGNEYFPVMEVHSVR